MTHTTEL